MGSAGLAAWQELLPGALLGYIILTMASGKRASRKGSAARQQPSSVIPRAFVETVRIDVVTGDDLRAISQRAGLSSRIIVTLNDIAIDMNEALRETCHTAMLKGSLSFADQAAWCGTVAARAEGLATLILSTTPGDCWAPWDAYELLQHGVPGSDDPAVAADLRQLLTLVAPSTSRTTLDGHFLNALATAAPGLPCTGHGREACGIALLATDQARR